MKHVPVVVAAVALSLAAAGSAVAQQPSTELHPQRGAAAQHAARPYKREVPRNLLAQARVSEDSALKIAMARMPGAKAQALELENENGHLMWSWEMKLEGKTGIEEVNVNALDGSIIGVEHENPAAERRDSTRARRPAAPAPAKPRP
jgi:uncharacterized membrane protein YkoI